MADWRAGLMRGSWRGVPFYCRDTDNDAGQRLKPFEFPDSDSVYVQPLGRGIKEYRLEVYVAGDDYMAWRDAFEAACDADGPGTLVHPYKGPLRVYCRYPTRLRELRTAGRAAYFDAVFVEAGGPQPPVPAQDTAATATASVAALQPLLAGAYAPAYDGESATAQAALVGALGQVQATIASGLAAAAAAPELAQDLATLAAVAPDAAEAYAAALEQLLADYVANVVAAAVPAADPTLAPGYEDWSRLPPMPSDPSAGLAALAQAITALAPAAAAGVVAANWQTLAQQVEGAATAALVTLYAQTDFASAEDADAAREQIFDLIVAQLEAAAGNDALVQAWRGVLTATVGDLTTRAKALPNVATVTALSPMPALALAQLLYQDGSQAPLLVQRNAAPHPLFMPLEVEYLQQ